jgi:stearoyl-CoA desaturase (delta-9 desaturase)
MDGALPESRSNVFSSPAFHRLQRRHFLLFDLVPAIVAPACILSTVWLPLQPSDLVLFFAFWLATGLGLTVGFHRYFAHRSFAAERPIALLLLVLGSMAARGPMVSWVAMHRRHHECSDCDGDLHSPNLHGSRWRGWLHAHLVWMFRHDYPNVAHYVPDLLRDKALMRCNRHYYAWVALGLAMPALIGGLVARSPTGALTGFLWGGVVRIFVVEQTMSTVNSLCHLCGSRSFDIRDRSRNIAWLGLPTWGEAHHNNHHAFPNSAHFGLKWHELDPGFWFIRALAACDLVHAVKTAKPSKRAPP